MYKSIPSSSDAATGRPASDGSATLECESQPLRAKASEETARWRLLASSVGLLADAYDIFTIDIVLLILEFQYGDKAGSSTSKSLIASALLLGIIIGQLSFGFVGDLVGRKWAFVTTAGLTILGAATSAFVVDRTGFSLPEQLALCRFILGIGIGGEYPLSASVTAEAVEDPEQRGFMLALVISMQGWGMLLSSVLAIVALSLGCSLEVLWRLLLAFGAAPSALAFCLRWQLHESSAFSKAREAHASPDEASRMSLIKKLWPRLLGTSLSWLLMNLSLYSLGSFKSSVLHEFMDMGDATTPEAELRITARFAAFISLFAIAGFLAALVMVNRMGRYWMQLMGFAVLTVLFLMQALITSQTSILLLGLVFFFQNFGPNTTTFIIPAEAFPTLIRASCHGISAASGKLGAFAGTMAFPPAEAAYGMKAVYAACAITAALGTLVTYVLTPRSPGDPDSIKD